MTYANRDCVREVCIKVRISPRDEAKLDALRQKIGGQTAAIARDLLLAQLDIALKAEKQEGPQ